MEKTCDIDGILQALQGNSLPGLRHYARRGLPDGCGLRPLVWQILLGSLPIQGTKRASTAASHIRSYREFLNEFVNENTGQNGDEQHVKLRDRIRNDVQRTLRSHHMFASNDERFVFVKYMH